MGDRKPSLAGGHGERDRPRRASKRVPLAIPVRLKIGGAEPQPRRLRDVSLLGLFVEGAGEAVPGDAAVIQFGGYPGVCGAFGLFGRVCRVEEGLPGGVAIEIDREASGGAALGRYRKLVAHYLRHRPLLDELHHSFFEARCEACGWLGRVGERKPICARCGEAVVRVRAAEPGRSRQG